MSYVSWIVNNWDKWLKICRVRQKEFTAEELPEVIKELLGLIIEDTEFEVILSVVLTVYEEELPFFNEEDAIEI